MTEPTATAAAPAPPAGTIVLRAPEILGCAQLVTDNRERFMEHVLRAAERDGVARVIVDLDGTFYISSAGLGALVTLRRKLRDKGRAFAVARLSADLQYLFEVTKIDTEVDVLVRLPEGWEDAASA